MNKISYTQLACLFFISRLFAEVNSHFTHQSYYGMQRFTVIALSFVLLLVVSIPLLLFMRSGGGAGVLEIIGRKSRVLGVIVGILLLPELLFSSLSTLVHLEYYAASTIFTSAPAILVIVLPIIGALYAMAKGLESAARTSVIVLISFVALFILIIVSICSSMDFSMLYPALVDRPSTLWTEVLAEFSKNAELPLLMVLCGAVREKPQRSLYIWLPCSFAVIELMNLLYMTVLGHYFNAMVFPFYTLSSFSDIVVLQRLDGIDAVVWTMAAIIRVSLLAIAVNRVLLDGLRVKHSKIVTVALYALLIIPALYFSKNETVFIRTCLAITGTGIPLAAVSVIIPVVGAICAAKKEKAYE